MKGRTRRKEDGFPVSLRALSYRVVTSRPRLGQLSVRATKPPGFASQNPSKGNTLTNQQLTRFVRQLVAEFQNRPKWEPVRLVNQESVSYGDQVANYTNMFAEFILRILEQKSMVEPDAHIAIQAFGTTFMRGGYYSTKPQEYLKRVFEYLKFLAVRRGLAATSGRWILDKLALNFGRDRAELVICDILSNASHDDFVRLDYKDPRGRTDTSTLLIAAFGERNWTLAVRELSESARPPSKNRLNVFLCHSHEDKPAVRALSQRLVANGIAPWFDEDSLLPGQDWEQEIARAVRKSDIVIVCLSQRSISKKGYVQREIKYALDVADEQPEGTIYLVPLKLEECEVPERLRRWHWVNLFEDSGYEQLMRALKFRAATTE